MESDSWQCGWCLASFPTKEDAAAHLRIAHGQSDVTLVRVDATTWTRDSHNYLFDKEASGDTKINQRILLPAPTQDSPVSFTRSSNRVQAIAGISRPAEGRGATALHVQLRREQRSGLPAVAQTPKSESKSNDQFSSKMMWRVVDSNGCSLQEGDVMRMGRKKMSVVQVCLAGDPVFPNLHPGFENDDEEEHAIPVSIISALDMSEGGEIKRTSSEARCRICLGDLDDGDEEGPMIQAPCQCKGSNGRVHTGCLQTWLATKYGLEDQGKDGQYLSYKPPVCDVCKTEFPVVVSIGCGPDAEQTSLIRGLTKMAPPFMVLSLPRSTDAELRRPNGERFIFAPNLSNACLKIGRSRDAHVKVKDVSISRVHSTISFVNKSFILKDNDSKFQTMIRPTCPEVLGQSLDPVTVQCGQTVLTFFLEKCTSPSQIRKESSGSVYLTPKSIPEDGTAEPDPDEAAEQTRHQPEVGTAESHTGTAQQPRHPALASERNAQSVLRQLASLVLLRICCR